MLYNLCGTSGVKAQKKMATILELSPIRKMVGAGIAGIAAMSIAAATAQAATYTYTFDYYQVPPANNTDLPISGGPFGTLTISDSFVGKYGAGTGDPNRVDINLTITPPAAYGAATLEQFYINLSDAVLDQPPVPPR